jgi:hypothetical protein
MQTIKLLRHAGATATADSVIELKNQPHLLLNCRSEKSKEFAEKHLSKFLLKKDCKLTDAEAEHIIDWLDSEDAPKRVAKMSVPQALEGSQKWQEKLNEQKAAKTDEQFIELVFQPTEKQFKIVQLVGKPAFEREGNLMKHCVASYFERKDCKIYSLRDEKNKPHCTIELGWSQYPHDKPIEEREKYIRQIKGKTNGNVKPEYVKPVIEFLLSLGVRVDDSQLGYVGYSTFEYPELIGRLEKIRNKPIRKIIIGAKTYFYKSDLYKENDKQN